MQIKKVIWNEKLLQDIKSIKDYPASTARQTCENICKNL